MKDEFRQWVTEIASSPAFYGIFAAFARWRLGDREGGWAALLTYVVCSLFVAWAAWSYMADEVLTEHRRGLYVLLLAFAAKDLLIVLASVGLQFRTDPLGVIRRWWEALRGGPRP